MRCILGSGYAKKKVRKEEVIAEVNKHHVKRYRGQRSEVPRIINLTVVRASDLPSTPYCGRTGRAKELLLQHCFYLLLFLSSPKQFNPMSFSKSSLGIYSLRCDYSVYR